MRGQQNGGRIVKLNHSAFKEQITAHGYDPNAQSPSQNLIGVHRQLKEPATEMLGNSIKITGIG